jgi:signal transduction histidine kinase/two-component SAPR family response regulator
MTQPERNPGGSLWSGGGAVGALCGAKRWDQTSLGPPERWPQSLKTVVRIVLSSRYQMWMGWGPDLAFFYNDAYRPTLGVKQEWALGASAREVWKEIWPDIGPRIERVLRSGEATWDEGLLLFLERSGYPEETYHTFSYSPLADENDEVVGMLCVVTEETERIIDARRLASLRELSAEIPKHNTRAEVLEASQRQLNQAVKDLPFTLLYLFDESGKAVLAARSGLDGEHPMAPPVIDPANAAAAWPVHELLSGRGMVVVADLQKRFTALPHGAWDKPPREALLAPIAQQGQAAPAGFLVAAINPYRHLDDAYRGFIDLVAGQLAAGLANAQAHEEAQRRADALAELDRAKTTFFSNISHELRTPLTLMLGPLEDMLHLPDGRLQRDHRQLLQIAQRNGVRLLKLVNTLLDFSRIEAGRMQATYEQLPLHTYTAELASAFRSAMEKAGLRLVVDTPPFEQPVYVDRDMWEKIILNLLSNAFKFTFQGEIRVETRTSAAADAAQVTIRDTGTGIPSDELPHLFDRFRRVEGARGRSIEGSGIGLALVLELVKAHGGNIAVTSEVGRGTAVTISIPFGSAHLPRERLGDSGASDSSQARVQAYVDEALGWLDDAGSEPQAGAPGQASGQNSAQTGIFALAQRNSGQRVLLVEDNADMRTYLQKLLQTAGFDVMTAGDGEQALGMAALQRPDLILSDIMMPKVDGLQLLGFLRADSRLRDIPVLLLSARAGEEAKVEGLAAGANDYLTKPFSARELIARVRANLDIAAVRRESQEALRRANESLERQVQERTADLRDKEARLRTIFGTTFTYQGYLSVDGTVLDANPTSLAGIQAALGEVVGRKFWETPWFSATPDLAEMVRASIPAVAAGETLRREIHMNLGGSGWRWFDFQMRPVLDARGHVVAIVPEGVDVTERRHAEQALRQAQKMEGIGQLTGGVAHDFNNLLTIILGSLETLRRQLKPSAGDTVGRSLESALRGTQRAASLTQRLLAFSRQQPLDPKPADLSRLVSSMSDLLRRTIGEQVAIETVLAGGLWRVNIDANQLEIAIINLAVNARDAMPAGGRLTIETANVRLDEGYASNQAEVVPGQYVLLAVTDTGSGMSPATAARAFEPFFTTKDVGHGTGLGLSQVYGFVKQSGGHVKIYSELGSGTTVKIYLPRLYAEESASAAETVPKVARGSAKETILAVEDDSDVRAQTTAALRELGYQVLEAGNGKTALEILAAHPDIDLLFTDVGLPGGMNGRQLAEAALGMRRKLKVLFTTGYARNAIVHDGRLDPGVQLLTKPFTFAGLSQKLRDMLDARSKATRILIVEDEELIQIVIAGHLEDMGIEVELAGSAAEAKNKLLLLNGSVDAAIIDMGLPDVRGDALIGELRAIYPMLPIVISSGHDKTAMQDKFTGVRNIEILTKPYTQTQLRDALIGIGIGIGSGGDGGAN